MANISTAFKSIKTICLWAIKGFSGLAFAWILTIMGKELINFGLFSFVFLLISLTTAFIYLVRGYRYFGVFCVTSVFIGLIFSFGFYVNLAYNP